MISVHLCSLLTPGHASGIYWSTEQFDSELERLNATLVLENHALQHENKQLSMLLKCVQFFFFSSCAPAELYSLAGHRDYEGTLESVMARFRTYAYNTQVHDLNLIRHYESLQQDQQQQQQPQQGNMANHNAYALAGSSSSSDPTRAQFQDPIELQASLFRLAALLRKALRASQGEDPAEDDEEEEGEGEVDEDGFRVNKSRRRRAGSSSEGDRNNKSDSSSSAASASLSQIPAPAELHAKLGGYLNLLTQNERSAQDSIFDAALQRDIELHRLQEENANLRGLLQLDRDSQL